MASVSTTGRQLIKNFEGLRLRAYQDAVGVWTIGYGHTGDVRPGMVITESQADDLLQKDLKRFEKGVEDSLTRPASQNQFDALVSLAYNIGINAFRKSSVLKLFNAGDIEGAAKQFGEYIMAGGSILRGLVRRRVAEIVHFLKK